MIYKKKQYRVKKAWQPPNEPEERLYAKWPSKIIPSRLFNHVEDLDAWMRREFPNHMYSMSTVESVDL